MACREPGASARENRRLRTRNASAQMVGSARRRCAASDGLLRGVLARGCGAALPCFVAPVLVSRVPSTRRLAARHLPGLRRSQPDPSINAACAVVQPEAVHLLALLCRSSRRAAGIGRGEAAAVAGRDRCGCRRRLDVPCQRADSRACLLPWVGRSAANASNDPIGKAHG